MDAHAQLIKDVARTVSTVVTFRLLGIALIATAVWTFVRDGELDVFNALPFLLGFGLLALAQGFLSGRFPLRKPSTPAPKP